MDGLPDHIALPRAVMLRDDDAGAGGQADEKAHDQIDDDQIRAADGGLWRIAEYPFIYNNPLKWPVIYEANKKTFRDPSNPNLIYPGQVLKIPSIKGETRSGSYDPSKTYSTFKAK